MNNDRDGWEYKRNINDSKDENQIKNKKNNWVRGILKEIMNILSYKQYMKKMILMIKEESIMKIIFI